MDLSEIFFDQIGKIPDDAGFSAPNGVPVSATASVLIV